MQFEEGEALRHSHYRGLSNSSIVEDSNTTGTEVSPLSPDLRQLRLDNKEKEFGLVSEKRVGEVSPVSPEEGGGWI